MCESSRKGKIVGAKYVSLSFVSSIENQKILYDLVAGYVLFLGSYSHMLCSHFDLSNQRQRGDVMKRNGPSKQCETLRQISMN